MLFNAFAQQCCLTIRRSTISPGNAAKLVFQVFLLLFERSNLEPVHFQGPDTNNCWTDIDCLVLTSDPLSSLCLAVHQTDGLNSINGI